MKLPDMKFASGIRKSLQVRFTGLNHVVGAQDGSIWDMENMTSDHAPVLATRQKRYRVKSLKEPGGLYAGEKLCWVDGNRFYYGGEEKGTVSKGQKRFASIGKKIVILPDQCWYDSETDTFGTMGAVWEGEGLTFCDGTLFGEEAKANGIQSAGTKWSDYFQAGDAVTISGCTKREGNNKTIIIREIDGDKLLFYEFSFELVEEKAYTETGGMKIERTIPELIYCSENENHLWGCSEDTIYASKQGDMKNWNVFDGLESDAYAVEPGSTGKFTGHISYRGYPIFFKEDRIYKVYGSIPSNYEVMGSATLGLEEGSSGSLAVAGETLFYLSRSGIMAYTGGIPQPMGAAFGTERYKNATAGSDGLKYYVSMENEAGQWGLYVYDTVRRMWHREDGTHATHFAYWNGNLYCLTQQGEIWILGNAQDPPKEAEQEGDIRWRVEFTDFTEGSPNKKGMSKIQLRVALEMGAELEVLMQFDSDGIWHQVAALVGNDPKRSHYLPIVPRRCDHYRLMLKGTGGCKIFSLVRELYTGSEMR